MRSKDLQRRADEAAIAASNRFVVTIFRGRPEGTLGPVKRSELYIRKEFPTLTAAREYASTLGQTDHYGRRPAIYAVTREEYTIHVE